MTENETERRLVQVISDHYLLGRGGKLTIQVASTRAGISRQSFNRYYGHLKPYVLGQKSVAELLSGETLDLRSMLVNLQARIKSLQEEVQQIKGEREEFIETVRASHITTLMNSDLALHNSAQYRDVVEKQSLHNEKLVKDVQRLNVELTLAKAQVATKNYNSNVNAAAEIISLNPELSATFRNYFKTHDVDALENEKTDVITKKLARLYKLCEAGSYTVFVFVDRYLSNFEKYVVRIRALQIESCIVIRLPIFNSTEIKMMLKKLPIRTRVVLHIPICHSEAVIKAQRKFLFKDIPEVEFEASDKMTLPSIRDGYSEVDFCRVDQGD